MSAYLARIVIFPFKSLDGMSVDAAAVLPGGALAGDRQWALVDNQGALLTAKRWPALHAIRLQFDPQARIVHVRRAGDPHGTAFHVDDQRRQLEHWFRDVLQHAVRIVENASGGFPDDTSAAGPTVVSTATLQTVAEWFPLLDLDNVRQRFRANLELAGVEPFWEDRLVGSPERPVRFRVGGCVLAGVNCCQRCAVPSRDPHSGHALPGFAAHFARRREASLRPWAARERFDHYYRLCVNTRLVAAPEALLRIGDEVQIIDGSAGDDLPP